MQRPTLIPLCKTRSGKWIQIGPASEWDRICAGFADQDYIDIYCVVEKIEVKDFRGEDIIDVLIKDVADLRTKSVEFFNSRPDLQSQLPETLERARIAERLLGSALDAPRIPQ